jgi:hypothetical protein
MFGFYSALHRESEAPFRELEVGEVQIVNSHKKCKCQNITLKNRNNFCCQ